MADIKETLSVVLHKLSTNRMNVQLSLNQATNAATQIDPDVKTAAEVLLKKFGSPQAVGQILTNVYQIDALADTLVEMDTMLASIQQTLESEKQLEGLAVYMTANAAAAQLPLFVPGSEGGTPSVPDTGSTSEAATAAA